MNLGKIMIICAIAVVAIVIFIKVRPYLETPKVTGIHEIMQDYVRRQKEFCGKVVQFPAIVRHANIIPTPDDYYEAFEPSELYSQIFISTSAGVPPERSYVTITGILDCRNDAGISPIGYNGVRSPRSQIFVKELRRK